MKLFEPFRIGKLELKNRMVMAPICSSFTNQHDGTVSDRLINWYTRVAQGGVGMIIVEATSICPGGYVSFSPGIHEDWQMEGLTQLADKIKANGAVAAIQIYSTGQWAHSMFFAHGWASPDSPSNVPRPRDERCRVLSTEEVKQRVEDFGEAARRAKQCGYELIEIHGAHGLLIAQFLSSFHNERTDEYGGATQKARARFLLEVIKRVREKVGPDFPLCLRLSIDECIGGERIKGTGALLARWGASVEDCRGTMGNTLADSKVYVELAAEAGINLLHITAGHVWHSPSWLAQPMYRPRACLVPLAKEMRQAVDIPLLLVGRINNPELAESILKQGHADLIGLGRPLIADPDHPKKALEGRDDEIRMCVACNHCQDTEDRDNGLTCTVNPEISIVVKGERIESAEEKKRVMVVGGGPAGMEAARVAAMRGHEVTLYERSDKLGGMINLACIPPGKAELKEIVRYYTRQLQILPVRLILNEEVSQRLAVQARPDVVIIAAGGIPLTPDVHGIDGDNVVHAEDVLLGKTSVGEKVVIMGGALVGCDTALFLAERGRSVTVVRRGERIGRELTLGFRHRVLSRFEEMGVTRIPGVTYGEISGNGLVITKENQQELLEADTVVVAVGYMANDSLYNVLKGEVPELYLVGDAKEPRSIYEAIHEAFDIAMDI